MCFDKLPSINSDYYSLFVFFCINHLSWPNLAAPLTQGCLPLLMGFVQNSWGDDGLRLAALVVLTNIATISEWHETYCPLLHRWERAGVMALVNLFTDCFFLFIFQFFYFWFYLFFFSPWIIRTFVCWSVNNRWMNVWRTIYFSGLCNIILHS